MIGLELQQGLLSCIQELVRTDQEIFWMRQRGLSYEEITCTMGLAEGTIASKFSRAKEHIMDCLKKAGLVAGMP